MLGKFFKSRSGKSSERKIVNGDLTVSREDQPNIEDPLFQNLDMNQVRIVPRDKHGISRKHISPNALKVLYKLDAEGYQAFLVGGSVRDLLLGNIPKDFDIATSATPEELKAMFRNSRIIGRRFKIIHIQFGREIIEVTTFRAHHLPDNVAQSVSRRNLQGMDSARSSTGMILRDNVYGDVNEDAMRRDFTVNALYYTIRNFLLLDFASGLQDMDNRLIRIIGDAEQRYKEDPVRMLRAVRFSAKLGFDIEKNTGDPIVSLASLLDSVAPARLFDESMKLLSTGYGERTFELLLRYGIAEFLFPATAESMDSPDRPETRLIGLALQNTDKRIADDKSVTPAFLFAALLWPVLADKLQEAGRTGSPNLQELQQAANEVLEEQVRYTAIPRRFSLATRDIWELQSRLERRSSRSVLSAWQHPKFRAAYDFLLLREESGEPLAEIAAWWTEFQSANQEKQSQMTNALTGTRSRRRRRPRSRSKVERQ